MTGFHAGHLLGCSLCHDRATLGAPLGTEIDDPVGGLDDIEVVLDDQDTVSLVHQPMQHVEQHPHVLEVQPGRGLVKDIEGPSGIALGELGGELDPLGFASRKRGRRLPEVEIA